MNDIKQGGSSTPQKPKGHVDFKSAFYFQTPVWIAEAPMFLKAIGFETGLKPTIFNIWTKV